MYETVIFDFGDPYDVFWALLWITAMNLSVDWYFLCWFFYGLKPLKKLKKTKPCKNVGKWYFLEGARNGQETMERLDINHDEDAWIRDMRFWWPLWCILITFMIWSLKLRGFNKQNLAKVFGFWRFLGGEELRWNRMKFQSSLPGLRDFGLRF